MLLFQKTNNFLRKFLTTVLAIFLDAAIMILQTTEHSAHGKISQLVSDLTIVLIQTNTAKHVFTP